MSQANIRGPDLDETHMNKLELINKDPSLSQFKYHFILKRVHIPKLQFLDFSNNIYRGFRSELININSVYIVQIMDTYDNYIYDIAVGFRKNSQAIAVYKQNKKFYTPTKETDIELAEAFQIYINSLTADIKDTPKPTDTKKAQKEQTIKIIRKEEEVKKRSVSRSRSRQSKPKKILFVGKFYMPLLPTEVTKEIIHKRICQRMKIAPIDLLVQERKQEYPCMVVNLRQSISVLDANQYKQKFKNCMIIREEQLSDSSLRNQIRKRQMRAFKFNQFNPVEQNFLQLAKALYQMKELQVVHIQMLDTYFIITTVQIINPRSVRLSGWKFQPLHHLLLILPSYEDRWYQFVRSH